MANAGMLIERSDQPPGKNIDGHSAQSSLGPSGVPAIDAGAEEAVVVHRALMETRIVECEEGTKGTVLQEERS